MALLWMDSFDGYATADALEKYNGANNVIIAPGYGRRSTAALDLATHAPAAIYRGLAPTGPTVIVGFAIKFAATMFPVNIVNLFLGAGAHYQANLHVLGDGRLGIGRGASGVGLGIGTSLGTTPRSLLALTYYHVQVLITLDDTVGAAEIRVNGVPWLSLTGVDTVGGGAAAWSQLQIGSYPGNGFWLDDLWVCDGSGAAPWSSFLGDCVVAAGAPTGAGAWAAWTPLAGANYAAVDDVVPDDDATYVSGTVGATDTFPFPAVPTGATIYGIQHGLNLKKIGAGVCTVAPVIRHGGVNYPGSSVGPGTAYAYDLQIAATNPGTGAAWTVSGINAAEFGYTRTA